MLFSLNWGYIDWVKITCLYTRHVDNQRVRNCRFFFLILHFKSILKFAGPPLRMITGSDKKVIKSWSMFFYKKFKWPFSSRTFSSILIRLFWVKIHVKSFLRVLFRDHLGCVIICHMSDWRSLQCSENKPIWSNSKFLLTVLELIKSFCK